jgi:hypothetical protein
LTCTEGAFVPTDCTATDQVCGDLGSGAACVSECELLGVDAAGTCSPDGIRHCEADHVVTTPCDGGTHCDASSGTPTCVSDACGQIGPMGRCTGDTFESCASGTLVSTDCSATGEVCAYENDTTGYACRAPGGVGAKVVTGNVQYEDKPPQPNGSLGAITAMVARGAQVTIVRDASPNTVLATAITADDGTYKLNYDATDGDTVHVIAAARDVSPARPIAVVNNQNRVHGQGGTSFAAAATATSNILATDATHVSEAFNILDQLTKTMDMIRSEMGDPTPRGLVANWYQNSGDGTYYDGEIHLLGQSSDDDGYDDTVILHESGHYVEDTQGRSDNPGGFHDGSPADPNLAWSEGFSTYLSMVLDGRSIYIDTNSGGGWAYDADTEVTTASAGGGIGQDVSENLVNECLWDLGDSGAGDDDGIVSGHGEVLRVESGYIRDGSFRAVGEPGVDLVDFLDGWFLSLGLSPCTGAEAIVTTTRSFPYDYAGPAGNCP